MSMHAQSMPGEMCVAAVAPYSMFVVTSTT